MGRPKKTPDSLPEGWRDAFMSLAAEGASDVELQAWVYENSGSLSTVLWARWLKEDDEFSKTIKICKILCQAWWEKQSRINLNSKVFQTGSWYANMKNRFGWRDKTETQHETSETLTFAFEKLFGGKDVPV